MGVNLVGMETAEQGMRYGSGTLHNLNYTVPRRSEIAWLAANGFKRTRLPFKWEMLQPILFDTNANAAARAAIGEPGAFNPMYQSFITAVLDANAAVGSKCMLDLHNYCRYRDFIFQPDGSVVGLVKPANPSIYAFTSDGSQVRTRIFATAAGATLTTQHFVDFWQRAARLWKDHPGLLGYGLMNEPYNLPAPGGTEETFGGEEDLYIWPTFAKAAADAIRAIDPVGTIFLDSNQWSGAMTLGTGNPAWPLQQTNLVYEVHMYFDASSSGQRFDYDAEVARGFSAGFGNVPINLDTGVDRLKLAVDWAQPRGLTIAVTETGMPIDDPRWEEMYRRFLEYAHANSVDVYAWNGGDQWAVRNAAINFTPGWHRSNKTMEPQASGPMKASVGISQGTLYEDGPGWAPAGTPLTLTIYARGSLAAPVTVNVASDNGGTFSKTTLTIPAGANGQDQFTFTPAGDRITTLTYSVASGGLQAPPPRRVYSLLDPVQYASTNLGDAAMAIIAKYAACKWDMRDAYTDFVNGSLAGDGQRVRAVSDSGYGSSVGNAMEMLNWVNNELPSMGTMVPPMLRVVNGRRVTDHSGDTWGLWCKKTIPFPDVQPNPRNRTPYAVEEPHFTMAVASVPSQGAGVIFQASFSGHAYASELRFANGQPQARLVDPQGTSVLMTAPTVLAAGQPAVISMTSVPGAQKLRVNGAAVGSGSATFANAPCDQLLIGMGFTEYYPRDIFNGQVQAVITGKGAPTLAELAVLERYLGSLAGLAL